MTDAKHDTPDPLDCQMDGAFHDGGDDGGAPFSYPDEDLYHVFLEADEDLVESADVAFQAALDALNDEADTYEYDAHEADEVMALAVGRLVAQMAQNALLDAHGNPAAAAQAVRAVLEQMRIRVQAEVGLRAFPRIVVEGDASPA